jgi:ABC-type transport system involved in multi-copper enzyme maturation permease subunit
MKGLLLKDFYSLQKYLKTVSVMLILYAVLGTMNDDPSFIIGMVILFFAMMSLTTFSYDETAHWHQYALSMPLSRKKIVLGKYILCLILTAAGGAVSVILSLTISVFKHSFLLSNIFLTTSAVCMIALLMMSVLFPLLYKFGVEKARLMMVLVFLIPFGFVMLLKYFNIPMPNEETLKLILYLSPLFTAIVMTVSYLISCRVFAVKEF